VPAIVLTGDISKDTLRQIAENGCVQLNKPIKPAALMAMIERLLRQSELARPAAVETARPAAVAPVRAAAKAGSAVHVIDDDAGVRAAIQLVLEQEGYQVCSYESAEEFLEMGGQLLEGCLLVDAYLPGLSGLELLARLGAHLQVLPAIMITGQSDVALAVQAMKGGAIDFIDKPVSAAALVAVVALALERGRDATKMVAWHQDAAKHIAALTARQRQIMDMVLAGHPSKNIAADLGISQRTVENHRASIMRRTGVKSLPALARLALAAVDDTAVGED
jgi:two-component system CheB/CheR fusion protein